MRTQALKSPLVVKITPQRHESLSSGIKDAQRRSDVTTILLFLEEKRFHREFCSLGTVTLTLIWLPVGWPPEFPNESGDFAGDRDDALVMTELLFFEHFKAMALATARMSRSG
ncbi:hypothetical protein N9C66_08180 [Akkermansiaceae bacterium]|nr:hypothetical protein [Akkermansiaceae bacterium]